MHWARPHVDPMLALRNIICSDRWEEAWPQIVSTLRQQEQQRRTARRHRRQATTTPPPVPPPVPVTPQPVPAPPAQRVNQQNLLHQLRLGDRPPITLGGVCRLPGRTSSRLARMLPQNLEPHPRERPRF